MTPDREKARHPNNPGGNFAHYASELAALRGKNIPNSVIAERLGISVSAVSDYSALLAAQGVVTQKQWGGSEADPAVLARWQQGDRLRRRGYSDSEIAQRQKTSEGAVRNDRLRLNAHKIKAAGLAPEDSDMSLEDISDREKVTIVAIKHRQTRLVIEGIAEEKDGLIVAIPKRVQKSPEEVRTLRVEARRLQEEEGMRPKDIATILGVSPSRVSEYLHPKEIVVYSQPAAGNKGKRKQK